MSIWGRVIGGAAGFALGGPIGAILGVMAGGAFDRRSKSQSSFNFNRINNNQKQQIFTLSFICLLYTSPSPRDQEASRMPSSA